MEVVVEKVSKVRREVTVTFLADRHTWKCIPFSLISSRSSPLVPLGPAGGSCKTSKDVVLHHARELEPSKDELYRHALKPSRPMVSTPLPSPLVGGMASKMIPDSAITASSYFMNNPRHGLGQMWRTRINNTDAAWRAACDDTVQCLRWDLGGIKQITKVQTKGNFTDGHWVTGYKLSCSTDGNSWKRLENTFTGNSDQDTLVENELLPPIVARFVRLHPTTWHEHISLRVELLGFLAEETCEVSNDAADACSSEGPSMKGRSRSPRRQ